MSVVALLTDFGRENNFVGVMKGVLLASAPQVQIVDLTHDIPAHQIRPAAFELLTSYKHFPEQTLFVCVVDPGVGSDRKILYAEADDRRFLAPDNGILSWVFHHASRSTVIDVTAAIPKAQASATFHGRDIFAPLAARLLNGNQPSQLGSLITSWVKLPFPEVQKSGSQWGAQVISIDAFGNIISNISSKELEPFLSSSKVAFEFGVPKVTVRHLSSSYDSVEKGKWLAINGSAGFVEFAVNQGHASQQSHLGVGDPITVYFRV